jgi:Mg-chelatase subunit ChlD
LDLGRAYLVKIRLGRAVDAGALAAARALREDEDAARAEAERVARANGVATGIGDVTTSLAFGTNERGEATVTFTATRTVSTAFATIVGLPNLRVSATAVAAVPPVDVVLVLDTSGSLATAGAFDELQQAAISFVSNFDDELDQMGLVSFQLAAHDRFILSHNFKIPVTGNINGMASAGDTNIGEGLRKAREQLLSGAARPNAAKVIVFFTDGRATAFRGSLGGSDRMLAVFTTGNNVRGYFNNPGALPPFTVASPNGCSNASSCFGNNANQIRTQAASVGAAQAALIRQNEILLYTIALGNPGASDPLLTPDLDYLRALANEGGVTSPNEPEGKSFFAPSAAELQEVFEEVAKDLVVRLAS